MHYYEGVYKILVLNIDEMVHQRSNSLIQLRLLDEYKREARNGNNVAYFAVNDYLPIPVKQDGSMNRADFEILMEWHSRFNKPQRSVTHDQKH